MINHVVLFKMKSFDTEDEKRATMLDLKARLEALKYKIEEAKYIEVGLNYDINASSFDLSLISHFESLSDLDVYRVHPEHKKVLEFIVGVTEARAAVDYEF